MTDQQRGDRFARNPVAAALRLFATQLAAVIGIAAVITVVAALLGQGDSQVSTAAPDTSPTAGQSSGAAPASSPPASSPPASSPPASSPPASSPPASSPATSPTETGSSAPTSTSATPDPGAKRPKVDVLNQSAGAGAAEATASRLRNKDWRIGRVDNFRGNVRATTVYYPRRGLRDEARDLARDIRGSARVFEAFSTLSDSRLSVILVR